MRIGVSDDAPASVDGNDLAGDVVAGFDEEADEAGDFLGSALTGEGDAGHELLSKCGRILVGKNGDAG
jgi:hypothetical protein